MDIATRTPERPRELVRAKQGHFFSIRYQSGQEDAVADVLARWAADKEIPLAWQDASEWGDDIGPGDGPAKGIVLGVGMGIGLWAGILSAIGGCL